MAEHSSLTDPALHEPKGASTAAATAVYISDGAGSGVWTALKNANRMVVQGFITDLSTAEDVYVAAPLAGKIIKAYAVIHNATSVANAVINLKIGGVAVTGGIITVVQSGSAAGSSYSCTPTAANTVTAGQAIQINNAAGSTTTTKTWVTIVLDVS